LDADGLTSGLRFACATTAEARAARRGGVEPVVVGLGGVNGLPPTPLVSFGLAGALRADLPTGTVLDAVQVVDERGEVLWEGAPLGVPGALRATILAASRVIDDPPERRRVHEVTGADAADLESGPIALSGRMHGALRVVSDTPDRTLHGICAAVKPQGQYDWLGLVKAFAGDPRGFAHAAADGRRGLDELTRATRLFLETALEPEHSLA
jgi:hypothetical protein